MFNKMNDISWMREAKRKVKNVIYSKRYDNILKDLREKTANKNESIIYVIGAPEHGNLGDHAIMDAELKFLKENVPHYARIEIPYEMIFIKLNELKELIKEKDIVCITGGGYMGSLWTRSEKFIRIIIENFQKNKIIMFPQTVYYETEFPEAKKFLEESLAIYNSHNDLTLAAREEASFEFFEKYYTNSNNVLVPDIGLYLNETDYSINREGILICLRSDREKVTNTNDIKKIIDSLSNKYSLSVTVTDTVLKRPVFRSTRKKFLPKKLNEFKKSKIIITDRLHGMIFAAVTSTPCIALDNKTGKVKGVYQWIDNQDFIILLEDIEQLESKFEKLLNLKKVKYNTRDIYPHFEPLIKAFNNK